MFESKNTKAEGWNALINPYEEVHEVASIRNFSAIKLFAFRRGKILDRLVHRWYLKSNK